MADLPVTVYLAGEIHSDWRQEVITAAEGLPVTFTGPVTDHPASDNCGVEILGAEEEDFWKDRKGAGLNAIRTRTAIGAPMSSWCGSASSTASGTRRSMPATPQRWASR